MTTQPDRRHGGSALAVREKLLAALLTVMLAMLVLPLVMSEARARDRELLPDSQRVGIMDLDGIRDWIRKRFSHEEIASLSADEVNVESHFCSCEDQPDPHYPYPVVLFTTPKGDLVARAEVHEHSAKFTPLAVRNGEEYCAVDSEAGCYGSFSSPCEFTDFRFGEYLEDFFPACK
jgi:hypothetical protein